MAHLPRRLRTKRGALLALGGVLVVIAAAFALVYFLLFPTSSPKKFAVTSTTSAPVARGARLASRWKVAGGSAAGYRVREKLAFLPAQSDAVGRTSAITGEVAVTDSNGAVALTSASFTADVSQLKSDRDMRDRRIHEIGLESSRYPTATFKLSPPLKLPASALSAAVVNVPATGVLTLHGTSKQERIPLQMRVSKAAIEAVGSITFPWSEFNMTAPSVGGFVNVTDRATMEFDLHLQPG